LVYISFVLSKLYQLKVIDIPKITNKNFILGKCQCGCNEDCSIRTKKGVLRTYISGHNMKGVRGENHPSWNNGRHVYKNKYITVFDPNHVHAYKNGVVKEHIKVFTDFHKCCLLRWADIHHIDGNKHNNDISNLQLLGHGQHSALTHITDMSNRSCFLCGNFKTLLRERRHGIRPLWYNYLHVYICNICFNRLNKRKKRIRLRGDFHHQQ